MQGPQEAAADTWRTTATHSPESMLEPLRILYFAGFPAPKSPLQHPEDQDGGSGKAGGLPANIPDVAETFVRQFFEPFGKVTRIEFDSSRGIGAVEFADGLAAEQCYVATHLSIVSLPQPSAFSEAGGGRLSRLVQLLYLEFGAFLPFNNSLLLRSDLLRHGGVSRQFLRTYPHRDARQSLDGASDSKLAGGKPFGTDRLASLSPQESKLTTAIAKQLGSDVARHPDLAASVTQLDAWDAFLSTYVREKALSPHATVARRVNREKLPFVQRYHDDEDLHGVAAYVCLKLRVEDEPTVGALLRKVGVETKMETFGFGEDSESADAADDSGKGGGKKKREASSARGSRLDAITMAENALKKVRDVPEGSKQQSRALAPGAAMNGVIDLIDRYAASGAYSSLMVVCGTEPIAAEAPMGVMQTLRYLWHSMRELWLMMIFLVAFVAMLQGYIASQK